MRLPICGHSFSIMLDSNLSNKSGGASHGEFLLQKSLVGHHTESFCSKKVWRSITRRVFAPKKFGGASHGEFLFQKSLTEHHMESFCSKKVWRSITWRVFRPKKFSGASHGEFFVQKNQTEHHMERFSFLKFISVQKTKNVTTQSS